MDDDRIEFAWHCFAVMRDQRHPRVIFDQAENMTRDQSRHAFSYADIRIQFIKGFCTRFVEKPIRKRCGYRRRDIQCNQGLRQQMLSELD